MSDVVVLVDGNDVPVGTAEKWSAHSEALLHRAFSIFLFDDDGNVLLQQRAPGKYHSAGLWSNTCCSHPRPQESTIAAAVRRLDEEMGITCGLTAAFSFVYRAPVGGGLIEHEYDHVFIGNTNATPSPDPAEVSNWKWMAPGALSADLRVNPGRYTYWLRIAWDELVRRGFVPAAH
jgi:isopentenyl-diphosphate Delta-isomerase